MKIHTVKLKVILLWIFAILLTASHPIQAQETHREVEETAEIKLYVDQKQYTNQKSKTKAPSKATFQSPSSDLLFTGTKYSSKHPKYILYGNLIYYQ